MVRLQPPVRGELDALRAQRASQVARIWFRVQHISESGCFLYMCRLGVGQAATALVVRRQPLGGEAKAAAVVRQKALATEM